VHNAHLTHIRTTTTAAQLQIALCGGSSGYYRHLVDGKKAIDTSPPTGGAGGRIAAGPAAAASTPAAASSQERGIGGACMGPRAVACLCREPNRGRPLQA
jgi:hypothetical protein